MFPPCQLVSLLQEIANHSEKTGAAGLALVARAALNIVADAHGEGLMPNDIACLGDLVIEFVQEGRSELLAYLKSDAPDCKICNALAADLRLRTI